jgi:hypothetical protein
VVVGRQCPWRIEYPLQPESDDLIVTALMCVCFESDVEIEGTYSLASGALQRQPLMEWRWVADDLSLC